MKKIFYKERGIESPKYWLILAVLAAIAGVGGLAALYMEHSGHWVTGMNNQVVWGTPHVFAVFLIVAASGALNVASIGSVFNKTAYKPLAPLSGLLAIALLLWLLWRRLGDMALVMAPLALAALLTVATAVLLDLQFNFANVVVLPLLLGIGVDSGIHLVHRHRVTIETAGTARPVSWRECGSKRTAINRPACP